MELGSLSRLSPFVERKVELGKGNDGQKYPANYLLKCLGYPTLYLISNLPKTVLIILRTVCVCRSRDLLD